MSPQVHDLLDDRNVADSEDSSVEAEPIAAGVQNGNDLQHQSIDNGRSSDCRNLNTGHSIEKFSVVSRTPLVLRDRLFESPYAGLGSVDQVAFIELRISAEGTDQESNFSCIVRKRFEPGEGSVDIDALLSTKVKLARVKPVH